MQEGHLKVVEFLFEKGANVDRVDTKEGDSPLSIFSSMNLIYVLCDVA